MLAAGLAKVATASFLASRLVPTGGFAVALAGGVALARAAQRGGLRLGVGASAAAMLQTVAIMGPARFGVPFTQAVSAPVLGRMEARGHGRGAQALAAAAVRLATNLPGTAFYIWVVVGLDAFAGSYDATAARLLPALPGGATGALLAAGGALLFWTVAASVVQAAVYVRGLRRWPADAPGTPPAPRGAVAEASERPGRYDPRAVLAAGTVAFALLVVSATWPVVAAVAVWLALAWATARGDRRVVRPGLVIAGLLAASTLVAAVVGGLGAELAVLRTVRAALLVLVAVWLRAAAGEEGLREVFRRALLRLHRLPVARETAAALDALGPSSALADGGRRLAARLRSVPRRPIAVADAVLDWVAHEAGEPAGGETRRPRVPPLRARVPDLALVVAAVACGAALPLAAG